MIILPFPSFFGHKFQPLYKFSTTSIYGPFKRFYLSLLNFSLTYNPQSNVTIYDVAQLSGKAYYRKCNVGFRSTGIRPFNIEIFTDDAFISDNSLH